VTLAPCLKVECVMTAERSLAQRFLTLVTCALMPLVVTAQMSNTPSTTLPAPAAAAFVASLDAAKRHQRHVWRDTAPVTAGGLVNAYIEIPRGEREKFELDMAANARRLDRTIPEEIGGYPVNYGFVPQTVSYDGDPFDALVLGPPLEGGTLVAGVIVGLMQMEDNKGLDSKVVLSPAGADGRPRYPLTDGERARIGSYFNAYKRLDPGGYSRVGGWGDAAAGRAFVDTTHAFFRECRGRRGACRL
jgi:inorganic pyrophosphatase